MNQGLAQTRELARGLCPTVLDQNDIHAALDHLSNNLEKYFGVTTEVKCDGAIQIEENAVAVHLYRIAQEAMTNAVKHGKAREIEIRLEMKLEKLVLTVGDNGGGFPPRSGTSKGMGLRIMQYRAGMIGATLLFQRPNKGGSAVVCFLPAAAETTNPSPNP